MSDDPDFRGCNSKKNPLSYKKRGRSFFRAVSLYQTLQPLTKYF